MIVKMKKVTVLCRAADAESAVDALAELGVLHIEQPKTADARNLEESRHQLERIKHALRAIPQLEQKLPPAPEELSPSVVDRLLELVRDIDEIREKLAALNAEQARIKPFGNFDAYSLEELRSEGICVRFYRSPRHEKLSCDEGAVLVKISEDREYSYFALFGEGSAKCTGLEIEPFKSSLSELGSAIALLEEEIKEREAELAKYSGCRSYVSRLLLEAQELLSIQEAIVGLNEHEGISFLSGFCPVDRMGALKKAASYGNWGLLAEDPSPDDAVPTLIKNPKWVELIRPVRDFAGIIPGYKEVDISAFFLVFFSLFFALIVGDAGYGMLFLLFSLYKLIRHPTAKLYPMLALMSLCTIVWGVLTGTYFGVASDYAPLPHLVLPWLKDENNLMELCFLIGALHLSIAHIWHFIRRFPCTTCLAQLGWLCVTWCMFFAARTLILGYPFPSSMFYLLGAGLLLAFVCLAPFGELKKEWANFIVFPLSVVSSFVDLVSYIRLFAVGMATFAVASAFNSMALEFGFGSALSGFLSAVIIFLGHGLNIALCTMGVLVHGIRLNALEFSTHLGMEWNGIAYSPLSRTKWD